MIVTYMRVSTVAQEFAAQRQAINEWIRQRGYDQSRIKDYADHGISGSTLDRPQFQEMLAAARAGRVTKVITFELSRLSRDFLGCLNVMKALSDSGVVVEVPGEGEVAFTSTIEQFVVAAKSLAGAQERESLKRRVKEGLAAARARGVHLGARPGDRRRLGKLKEHSPELIERLRRLSRRLTCREVASEMGLSLSTVSRLQRRYLRSSAPD